MAAEVKVSAAGGIVATPTDHELTHALAFAVTLDTRIIITVQINNN